MNHEANDQSEESGDPAGRLDERRIVVVCMECGRQKAGPQSQLTVSEELARRLEREAQPSFRVVRTTCLDHCPKNRVTVGVPVGGGESLSGARFVFVDPIEEMGSLTERLRSE